MWRWISSCNTNKGSNATSFHSLAHGGLFDHRRICKRKTKTNFKIVHRPTNSIWKIPQGTPKFLSKAYSRELITKNFVSFIWKWSLSSTGAGVATGGGERVGMGNPKSINLWSGISSTGSSHFVKLEKFSALKNWLELYKSWSLLRVLIKGFLELAKEGLLLMVG